MNENPYHPPPSLAGPPESESRRTDVERPVGVSILAVLHLIGGVLLFGVQFILIANLSAMEEPLRGLGIPPLLLVAGVMFLAVLTIASGVGMWIGARWGWWLAAFYYVYSIFRNGSAILTVAAMADQLEGAARGPEYYVMKHTVRVIVSFFLFLYFFKGNVLEFFGLATLSKAKAVAILVGICLALLAATSAVGVLST